MRLDTQCPEIVKLNLFNPFWAVFWCYKKNYQHWKKFTQLHSHDIHSPSKQPSIFLHCVKSTLSKHENDPIIFFSAFIFMLLYGKSKVLSQIFTLDMSTKNSPIFLFDFICLVMNNWTNVDTGNKKNTSSLKIIISYDVLVKIMC